MPKYYTDRDKEITCKSKASQPGKVSNDALEMYSCNAFIYKTKYTRLPYILK